MLEDVNLTEVSADHFAAEGWLVLDNFADPAISFALHELITARAHAGVLRKAGIGRQDEYKVEESRRGDWIEWVDPEMPEGSVSSLVEHIEKVRAFLNRTLFLGLVDFEMHFTMYPVGTHYERHSDRHRSGSTRRVSFVLYLNPDWKPGDGGELVIYPPGREQVSVEPLFGRLALFLSELEHEVLKTHIRRISTTGWMRERNTAL